MAPKLACADRKLNKNKSVKLFREKQKKRDAFAKRRNDLRKQYDHIDLSKIEKFEHFPLSTETQKGLKMCNYMTPTEIQLETVGLALKGDDILGAAKTGSGKTLAFVIPILERLFCEGWCKTDGLGALVITPTRELAMQIFEVCRNVGPFHGFTMGLVIGGKDLRQERKILNLYNIVIGTPGRLLQHMDQNPLFNAMNLQMLVLDEADRILDLGFQKEMNAILEHLPQERQTLLFSATQTKSVKDLARLSLNNPTYVSVHEHAKHATPEGLEQSYIVCELHKKMDFLWSFLKNHKHQKILVFMASCKQVKYTFEVFCRMKPGVSLTALYGGLHQLKRMEKYRDFCRKNHVVMFATDLAARGLDFPNINWVVQLDCPEDANTYIHRAGRTARYQNGGESLLVLLPSEKDSMIKHLEERRIPINEMRVHSSKMLSVQRKMEALCARDSNLKESAQRAFKAYYKSVFLMKDKTVFDINQFNCAVLQEAYAKSLGLAFAPRIRFIEKRCKAALAHVKSTISGEKLPDDSETGQNSSKSVKLNFQTSDDSDAEDFLKPKSSTLQFNSSTDEEISDDNDNLVNEVPSHSKKALTKAALAKKILKKKIKPNIKIKFNDEGSVIEDVPRKQKAAVANELAEEMEKEGYNIEKAKRIMDAEDEVDKSLYREKIKQKHKEERMKLKEQRRQDKDRMAPQLETSEDVDDEEDNDGNDEVSENSDEEIAPKRRKLLQSMEAEEHLETADDQHEKLADETAFDDEEMLALHFLRNS